MPVRGLTMAKNVPKIANVGIFAIFGFLEASELYKNIFIL